MDDDWREYHLQLAAAQQWWPHSWERRATFRPKHIDTMRPECAALVGQTFDFIYAGFGDDDEPYPGQTRWMIKDTAGDPAKVYWFPDEDLSPPDSPPLK